MPSNLVATVLQDYISQYAGRMDANEQRPSEYGGLNLFKAQTNSPQSILDPEVKANIEKSFNNTVKVPVIDYKDISIGSARTCAIQSNGLTSSLVTLTAVTYAFGIAAYPMQHYENFVSYQTALNKLIDAGLQKLASTIDTACIASLEANKNAYFPQAVLDFYAQVGGAFQVAQADKTDLYNQIAGMMQTADFMGTPDITTNPIGMTNVRRLAAQGEGNSVNQGFQLLGYTWYPTNRVTNGAGTIESTLYAVAPGSVAIASRNSPDGKARTRVHESKYWDIFPNAPYVGMDLDVFYQADCADASAIQASGLTKSTQTKLESWQFSVDVFYLKFYNSDAVNRYNPIFKYEITNA
jgi:hypothetical protein